MVAISKAIRETMILAAVKALREYTGEMTVANVAEVAVNAAADDLEVVLTHRRQVHGDGSNVQESGPTALGGPPEKLREVAQAQGFSGEACPQCMNFRMRRTGTCLTCQSCGFNKGCD